MNGDTERLLRTWLRSGASLICYAVVGCVAGASNVARAEEAQVEDVKVTRETGELSPRKLEVLKIPRPIVVVDQKTLQQEHLMCLEDFALKIPNYRPNTGGGGTFGAPYNSLAAIRGVGIVGGAATGWGGESDTGFILDNVFYKYAGFSRGNFIDLQSVEVALGPQGTAGGKNTTVGNIVIRTQLPSFTRQTTLETSFGNYNRITQNVSTTGPIIDDKLAYRISGYFDKGDGWIRDQATGADYLNTDQWGVKGQLLYVGDSFTNRLVFSYYASHSYDGYNTGPFADTFLIYANGTTPSSTYSQNLTRIGRPLLTLDPYKPYLAGQGGYAARYLTVTNELNWTIGENTLTSITGYGLARENGNHYNNNQEVQLVTGPMDAYVEQFSQEVRLSSPKDQQLEWSGGLFGYYEYIWTRMHHFDVGPDSAAWFKNPALLTGNKSILDGKVRTFQFAAYGNATYHFDDQWSLTLGLRDSYEIKEGSDYGWEALSPSALYSGLQQYQALNAVGGKAFFDTGGQSTSRNFITGTVNPKYKLNENILVYSLFGYGEKGAAASAAVTPVVDAKGNPLSIPNVVSKPMTSWDYEVGVKTNWLDGRLILNANLYWNDLYNLQAIIPDTSQFNNLGDPIRVPWVIGNVNHVRLRGVEFDGRWSPIERLWINFSGSYTEARYLDFENAAPPNDWLWAAPAGAPASFIHAPKTLSRTNTRLEGLPWWSFNVGFNYDHPIGNALRDFGEWANRPLTAFIYTNASWNDKTQLTNPRSVYQYWQPDYAIVNAGVGLRSDDSLYSFTLWVKNIADERPIWSWQPGTATTPATVGLPLANAPRKFGGTLRVKF